MKKAAILLVALLAAFTCLETGILIGRRSSAGTMIVSGDAQIQTTSAAADTQASIPAAQTGKINVNTASASLLQTLPNIGEILSQRIVDYREQHGAYTAPEDLLQVEGIGEKRLNEIRNYITVGD